MRISWCIFVFVLIGIVCAQNGNTIASTQSTPDNVSPVPGQQNETTSLPDHSTSTRVPQTSRRASPSTPNTRVPLTSVTQSTNVLSTQTSRTLIGNDTEPSETEDTTNCYEGMFQVLYILN